MHQDRIASGGASGEGSQGLASGLNNVAGQPHLQEVTGLVEDCQELEQEECHTFQYF